MKTRILGKGGPEITLLGFGAWAIGGPWAYGWGAVDDTESIRAIQRAIDLGVSWIDTAAAYGLGHSEEIVGRALFGIRKEVFVATKCGLVRNDSGHIVRDSRPESIRREIDGSLRRLKVDSIDLYQLHWHDAGVPLEDAWGTMARLQQEGKVRYIGVSNFDVPLLRQCMTIAPVQSLQPPYNMLNRTIESEILPFCESHGIGVICYSPMGSGLLTGRFDFSKLAPDDWRRKDFDEQHLARSRALVERLMPIAAMHHTSVGQLAVAWVLRRPEVTAAIVGARSPWQVDENVGAAGVELSVDDMRAIDDLLHQNP